MITVLSQTGYTEEQIKTFYLRERLALQKGLENDNKHTAVLIVDAVVQGNEKVKEGLLVVTEFHLEFGELTHELFEFRNWLSTLLVK